MRVFKWGNSLAIRLPAAVVEALKLRVGAEIEVHITGERALGISDKRSRDLALKRIMALRKKLPADWKFDRDEANAR
jgi:antitoxin MazE